MPEPTRYSFSFAVESPNSVVESVRYYDYIRYTDYAALRKLAEAVVEAYNDGEMPEKPLRSAIKKLREALR